MKKKSVSHLRKNNYLNTVLRETKLMIILLFNFYVSFDKI